MDKPQRTSKSKEVEYAELLQAIEAEIQHGLKTRSLLLAVLAVAMFLGFAGNARGESLWVYIGTYTGAKSKGIYVSRLDTSSGKLAAPELAAETRSPSFLALHPTGPWLYAAGEVSDFGPSRSGMISAFQMDRRTGKLKALNQQSSGGGGPCHLAVDHAGKCVLTANYGSGSVAALPLRADGSLGEPGSVIQHHGSSVNRERQAGPHAHFIVPDPANNFALACDLGLDHVLVYRLDAGTASLVPNDPPFAAIKPGSGPRHLVFSLDGKFAYVVNEMASTVTAMAYDAKQGSLRELQTVSTLPTEFKGQSTCAEIQLHPSGRFVYASNRGSDSIAVFAVAAGTGELSRVEVQPTQGKTPRHFGIDPSGRWLLAENQGSDSIIEFQIDGVNGRLTPTGERIVVGSPVCTVFAGSE
jgi:6-phosphogluconolactonase